MEPIGTVPQVQRTVVEDEGDSGVTTPNSGTPNPMKSSSSSTCAGAEFDPLEDALRQCTASMPKAGDVPSGMRDRLEVKAVAGTPTISAGGRVDVTVSLKNKSNDPLPLYFTGDPFPRFEIEAVDAKGKRADMPAGKAPAWPKGTTPPSREAKASRITLAPGGSAKVKLPWDAVKTKWAPEKAKNWEGRGFPREAAGPLPPGKYLLRVSLPLVGVYEKGDFESPKVPIEVTK